MKQVLSGANLAELEAVDRAVTPRVPHWRPHRGQMPPERKWRVWTMLAGRGFGKTRAGAEWVSEMARTFPFCRIALIGATIDEVAQVMVRGRSGLMAVALEHEDLIWRPSAGTVTFASGAQAFAYSGENPEKLRGPEHHFAWCDELAKWRYPEETWDNLMLGLRLGARPLATVTTTPRPVPLLKRILDDRETAQARGRTRDNPHLPDSYVEGMEERYGGTRTGRQELDGELIEDVEGALWTRALVERCRCVLPSRLGGAAEALLEADRQTFPLRPPDGGGPLPLPQAGEGLLVRVVIGVDPPVSAKGDACGIVAVALGADGIGYVLGDHSVGGLSPDGWARAVAAAAEACGADRVVAEANQGGEMVRSVLQAADCALPVRLVHARRGKAARAEPVAALFENGRAKFAGVFPQLEDELCALTIGGGYAGPTRSPDRADAMVWAMTELMLRGKGRPAVRGL